MNLIILALSALAELSGAAACTSIPTEDTHFFNAVVQHYGYTTSKTTNSILNSFDVYNIDGINKYLLLEFDDGKNSLFDKETNKILQNFDNNVYENIDCVFRIFEEENNVFGYYDAESNLFRDCYNNNIMNFEIRTPEEARPESAADYFYTNVPFSDNAHVISNAFFFEKLFDRHALNSNGTCTIVATEILLNYYDTFYNDKIIPELYETKSEVHLESHVAPNIGYGYYSPGVDNRTVGNNSYHDYLCNRIKNDYGYNAFKGSVPIRLAAETIEDIFSENNIPITLNTSVGNPIDLLNNRAINVIKNAIDNDRPLFVAGRKHATVAYAYDENMVWVHTGWGYTAATPWDTFIYSVFGNDCIGAIDISSIGEHVHSDNYYFVKHGKYVCPCGHEFKKVIIRPNEFGFEPQYFFKEKTKTISLGDLILNTKRLRTGFIENEYINLSAARKDAGYAYFECEFNKKIRYAAFMISYWQSADKLYKLDSSAWFMVKHTNFETNESEWTVERDLIDMDLSTDREDQNCIYLRYVGNEITGFRIETTALAVGNRNLGRISLGSIYLVYSD